MILLWMLACSDRGFSVVRDAPLAPEPDIQVDPQSVGFDPVAVGCLAQKQINITNVGKGPLEVWKTTVEGFDETVGDYSFELFQGEILAGETETVAVNFEPSFVWDAAATLVIESDDPDEPKLELPVAGSSFDPTWTLDVFKQEPDPIDVLWVIDNSGSMYQERDRVTREIAEFFLWFQALDLDWHMGVITTDVVNPAYSGKLVGSPTFITPDTPDPEATLTGKFNLDGVEMGQEAGLQAMEMAISEPLRSGHNEDFYRPEARLVVIFLTDEGEQSARDADWYISYLAGLKDDPDDVFVAAIVGDEEEGCRGECPDGVSEAKAGDKYLHVSEAYGGFEESICKCDLAPALERMGFESTWYVRAFPLSQSPGSPSMLTVWVDGEEAGGWSYDPFTNAIVFDTAPPLGTEIVARYPVEDPCATAE